MERDDRGHGLDAEALDELAFLVHVDLGDQDVVLALTGDLFQVEGHGFAWATPCGPEIYQHDAMVSNGGVERLGGENLGLGLRGHREVTR